jgi:hypothetical protein
VDHLAVGGWQLAVGGLLFSDGDPALPYFHSSILPYFHTIIVVPAFVKELEVEQLNLPPLHTEPY